MRRSRWIWAAALIGAWIGAGPAVAQWRAEGDTARDPGRTLSVSCGPDAAPFTVTLGIAGRLIPPETGDRLTVTIHFHDLGYRFAPAAFDPGTGRWQLPVAMTDPFAQGLFTTRRLVLDAGPGRAWEYRTAGLADALAETFGTCIDRWRRQGHAVPAALAGFGTGAAQTQPGLPDALARHIAAGCGGGYDFDRSGLLSGLIDGDDRPDYVLHWNDVRCLGAMPRPFCGAANCSIDVFLSGKGYRPGEGDALLGTSAVLVPLSNGRSGIGISGTMSLCGSGACDRPFWWDGTRLRQ